MPSDYAEPINAQQRMWIALKDAANAEWAEKEAEADDKTRRIYAAAKALYRQRHCLYGKDDPIDRPVMRVPQVAKDAGGWAIHGPIVPAWTTLIYEVWAAVQLVEEMGKGGVDAV